MITNGTEFVDTVIVGGGQAGLVMGYELARQGRDFVILDAARRVGDAWRERWDSLELFTAARFDGLPGMPFPGDPLRFPTKDEVADFLEEYARVFDLPVRSGVHVDGVRREGGRFVTTAVGRRWESANVVVATGGCQAPKVPEFAGKLDPGIVQLHSSEYRNPSQLPDGPVLIVGMGNSGAEIARNVAATRPTTIAGTPGAQAPVRPTRTTARLVFPLLRFAGLHVVTLGTPLGRAASAKLSTAPLVRTRISDLVELGVGVVPRITGTSDGRPVCADGTVCTASSVIWCTGYRDEFDWIDLPVFDDRGEPVHRRGVVDAAPGLYFLGLEFLYALASATIPGIGRDARHLAKRMSPPVAVASAQEAATGAPEPAGSVRGE
jgi:putative flavoprotein involved in K+ transport